MITYGDARDAALDTMFAQRGGITGYPEASVVLSPGGGVLAENFESTTSAFTSSYSGGATSTPVPTSTAASRPGGTRSAVVTSTSAGGSIYTTEALPCTPGAGLSASCWIRGGGDYALTVRYFDAAGTQVTSSIRATLTASSSTAFERINGIHTVPANTAIVGVRFEFSYLGSGTHYFDDVLISGFDGSLAVQQVTVTRELAGDLPSDVSLVAGAVSSSVDIAADLEDDGPHPALASGRSVLGSTVSVRAGYGPTYSDPVLGGPLRVPLYRGVLRTISFDDAAHSRSMQLMDRSDQMRAPVTIPPYGSYADRQRPEKLYRFPTNLSNVIACALHESGIRCTPAPPTAGLVWSTSLVGGALADVGFNVPSGHIPEGDTWLRAGPFGPMPTQPSTAGEFWFFTGYPGTAINLENTLEVRVWLDTSVASGFDELFALTVGAGYTMYGLYDRSAGQVLIELRNPSNGLVARVTLTAAASSGTRCVQAQFRYGGSVTIAGRIDTGTVSTATSSPTSIYAGRDNGRAVNIRITPGRIQQASLQATASGYTFADPPAASGFPQADVDTAALDIDYFPGIDARVAWALCKEVAGAELGMVGFSEIGRFYFRNRATLNGATSPVLTFDTDLVDNIAGSASIDSVRDGATIPCTRTWFLDSGIGVVDAGVPGSISVPSTPVYFSGDALAIQPGSNSILIKTSRPILPDQSMVRFLDGSSGRETGRVYDATSMTLCTSSASSAVVASATGFYASLHPVDSTTWRLDVYSPSSSVRYAVWPKAWESEGNYYDRKGGQGSLIILGRISDEDISVRSQAVTVGNTAPGARVAELADTIWAQNPAALTSLATSLLANLASPRLQLSDITVPADLRLQVGDVVQLNDWAGRVPSIVARVIRLRTVIGGRTPLGMTQTLSLRTL